MKDETLETFNHRETYDRLLKAIGMPKYISVGELYGVGFGVIIDRFKYKGRGRPKKSDYMELNEAQARINTILNDHLNSLREVK